MGNILSTAIVGIIILTILTLIVVRQVKNRSNCNSGCSGCSKKNACQINTKEYLKEYREFKQVK